ncbi:RraA family protein [Streptomyces sp. NPDC001315]|uniref:RraA family protein n=1 Tax=Streptomyces sp. NPDC001315 TaxID=3364562 RepID=UPI0036CD9579
MSLTPTDLLSRLAALDTCAVSDALDRHGLTGAVPGVVCRTGQFKVVGRAVTVELAPAGRTAPATGPDGRPRHLCTAAVAASGPGDVLVVSHPGGVMAGWGGLLSLAASLQGIEATLLDGPCRDVDESRECGYPVFAPDVTPITARSRIVEASWGEPVTFAGVAVTPGDLVLADGSGITFVPAQQAHEVVATAEAMAAREAAMAADVRAGMPITEVMGASYEAHTAGAAS